MIPTGNLDGYWGEYNRTPYEFPLLRLGDVLLMLAEAYNEADMPDKAVTEINKVRARAGMPGLNSGAAWLATPVSRKTRDGRPSRRLWREPHFTEPHFTHFKLSFQTK